MNLLDKLDLFLNEWGPKSASSAMRSHEKAQRMKRMREKEKQLKEKEKAEKKDKKNESIDESTRINWNTVAYKYSHGKFPLTTKEPGLWMFELNGKDKLQYQGKWAEAKKYVENEVKLRVAKGIYGKSGRVDVKVMP
jgi:hypothetical protein